MMHMRGGVCPGQRNIGAWRQLVPKESLGRLQSEVWGWGKIIARVCPVWPFSSFIALTFHRFEPFQLFKASRRKARSSNSYKFNFRRGVFINRDTRKPKAQKCVETMKYVIPNVTGGGFKHGFGV